MKNLCPRELIFAARDGDSQAFALLYEEFFTPVFRYIFSKINNRDDAEDLTQNVFLRAFGAIKNFEDQQKSPLAYFFTIARNLIIDFWRKKRGTEIEGEEKENVLLNLPTKNGPRENFQKKEKSEFVEKILEKLKPEYREILELKFLQDFSTAEIAEKTGKSLANVRQIQVRALRKLKNLL